MYFVTEEEDEEVRMLTTAFFCEQDKQYYKLQFFTSTVERDDLVKNMLYLLVALWLCLALAITVLIKKIIHKSNKPFYKLLDDLKAFKLEKNQNIEFSYTEINEYAELNSAVKGMLDDNIRAFSDQKNFIENASHELQTPLAVVSTKLENLIEDKTLNEKQIKEIHSAISNLQRMKRLNGSLLLLSKIKNKQFADNEPVDIEYIVKETVSTFQDLIDHKGIEVISEKKNKTELIQMNKDLAYIMINNLLKNSIYHNIKGGKITIIFDHNSLVIANDGAETDKKIDLFKRYQSRTNDALSSGLGLSIVKSITEIYGLSITHEYNGRHIFTLIFPSPTSI